MYQNWLCLSNRQFTLDTLRLCLLAAGAQSTTAMAAAEHFTIAKISLLHFDYDLDHLVISYNFIYNQRDYGE